jgi:DNA-binding IclR family transcriptional regulator
VFKPQDRWLSHREIVRRIALPPATVSRLTFTLTAMGYLKHREDVGEYALSPAVLGLGFSMLGNFDIARIARPTMQALADKCQAAVSLGARHGLEMIYVAHSRSTARLILGLDVGARLPIARTSMGRAVLCGMSPGEREMLMQRIAQAEGDGVARREEAARRGAAAVRRLRLRHDRRRVGPVDLSRGRAGGARRRADLARPVGRRRVELAAQPCLREEVGPLLVEAARTIVSAIHAADWKD